MACHGRPGVAGMPIASSSGSTICGTSGGFDAQGCIAVFIEQGPPDPPLSNGQ